MKDDYMKYLQGFILNPNRKLRKFSEQLSSLGIDEVILVEPDCPVEGTGGNVIND